MLGFATLTLAPFDRALIDPPPCSAGRDGVARRLPRRVREELSPLLDAATRGWLERATAPLGA